MSSPVSHPVTTIASFIAPRTVQPTPPTRPQYTYGPGSSSVQSTKSIVSPPISAAHLNQSQSYKSPSSTSALPLDRNTPNRGSAGDIGAIGTTRKLGSMDHSDHQGFGSNSGFAGFAAAASTWDVSIGGNKSLAPTSLELPAPINTGYQSSSIGHNPWGGSGLSLPGPSLMQPVGDNGAGPSFGSPFLTSLPTTHQHQQHQQQQQRPPPQQARSPVIGSSLDGLHGYGENELDLGNAGGEVIKDVLAMTGAIDSEEFAKIEAEYSLLNSGVSSNGPSRAVGGGRSNSGSGASGGPAMAALWGGSNVNGSNDGLPSPIGTMNGHSLPSARRGLDAGYDSHGTNGTYLKMSDMNDENMDARFNVIHTHCNMSVVAVLWLRAIGLLDPKEGISEYSQWNSGFTLNQTMYSSSRQQGQTGSSAFMNSFFGSDVRTGTLPYGQHLQTPHPLGVQPLSPFEYSSFSGLGGPSSTGSGTSLASPTSPSFGSIGAIGGSRPHHQSTVTKSGDDSPNRN